MRYAHGLVLGKFYPLHAGHQNLIRSAAGSCDRLTVEVLAASVESIPLDVREAWIRAEHPTATVVGGMDDHPVDFDDPAAWDAHMAVIEQLLPAPVDAVFTSDAYGAELARRLDATWVQVDPDRRQLPVSGTAVRADIARHWWALPVSVRETLCRRVVVLGAESTGSTTLAEDLAVHYATTWVPEYGREWSIERPGGPWHPWQECEFDLIAAEHQRQEREAMRTAPIPLVISDTDALATSVWHERYLGSASSRVAAMAEDFRPDLYLLTGDEIAFVQDGWRDGEHIRATMQQRFRQVLDGCGAPWVELQGTRAERLQQARSHVDDVLRWTFADPLG